MGKRIVFLNLADMHEHGLAQQSVAALGRKYPRYSWLYETVYGANQIQQVDLFRLLRHERNPPPVRCLQDLMPHVWALAAKFALLEMLWNADKIMLGVHGRFDDTDQGFAGLGWGQGHGPIGSVDEFADLFGDLLVPGHTYKVALIVCFGARSRHYRKDHYGGLTDQDIKSSFAFKFYKRIYRRANVTMTARTGSVGFDSQTGRSLVQTEAAVQADIEFAEIQGAQRTRTVADRYTRLGEQLANAPNQQGGLSFPEMDELFRDDPMRPPQSTEQSIVKDYANIRTRLNALTEIKGTDRTKYGKFVYTSQGDRIQVYRKYDAQGQPVMTQLFDGPP
jgi:hypothetical protein